MSRCLPLVKLSEIYPWNIVRWLNKHGRPPNTDNDMGTQQTSGSDCLHTGLEPSSGGIDKSTTHNNNTETKPDSLCLMEGCGKIHRSARSKKATQSLAFCDLFKGMNLKQRTAVAKKLSACKRCLQPGHGIKTCKLESLKCRTCDGK